MEQVRASLEKIRELVRDPEMAHVAQDDLYRAVLEHAMNGGSHVREMARIALMAEDIDFARWYA